MRAFFVATLMAAIIGMLVATGAIAHEGWFMRVCPTKTEANRVHLAFSGGGQGFSWSWIKGERTMKRISRAAFAQCQSSISVGSQSRCRETYNLTPMSASGSVTISLTAWNSMITRFAKGIGTIPMIVPVSRVTEEPRPSLGKPFSWVGKVELEGSRPGRLDREREGQRASGQQGTTRQPTSSTSLVCCSTGSCEQLRNWFSHIRLIVA